MVVASKATNLASRTQQAALRADAGVFRLEEGIGQDQTLAGPERRRSCVS
jgi:hypothetical protein